MPSPISFQEYADQLLYLNKDYPCDYTKDHKRYADLGFCLVEELLEFAEAYEYSGSPHEVLDRLTKEAGDVLAFVTLLLDAHKEIVNLSDLVNNNYGFAFESPYTAARTLARSFRQWFRKGETVYTGQFILALNCVLDALKPHNITFTEIAQTNLDKLYDRSNRQVLFTGAGDNR